MHRSFLGNVTDLEAHGDLDPLHGGDGIRHVQSDARAPAKEDAKVVPQSLPIKQPQAGAPAVCSRTQTSLISSFLSFIPRLVYWYFFLVHKLSSTIGMGGYFLAIVDFLLGPYLPQMANVTCVRPRRSPAAPTAPSPPGAYSSVLPPTRIHPASCPWG